MVTDQAALEVLQQSGLARDFQITRVGGGFSDAVVWRVEFGSQIAALKVYPSLDAGRLSEIHRHISVARSAGITVLPEVLPLHCNQSVVEHFGVVWDLVSWQPGEPALDFYSSQEQIQAAAESLSELHSAWRSSPRQKLPSGAVRRRLEAFDRWHAIPHRSDWMDAIEAAVSRRLPELRVQLEPWRNRPVFVQPIHGDLWSAHLLYTNEAVTGIIDHAAMCIDTPMLDLSRLIGSIQYRYHHRVTYFDAYERVHNLSLEDNELNNVLATTGDIAALICWYERLALGQQPSGFGKRIRFLLSRVNDDLQ